MKPLHPAIHVDAHESVYLMLVQAITLEAEYNRWIAKGYAGKPRAFLAKLFDHLGCIPHTISKV